MFWLYECSRFFELSRYKIFNLQHLHPVFNNKKLIATNISASTTTTITTTTTSATTSLASATAAKAATAAATAAATK